jgi:phosphohistidine phosphatase
MVSDSPRRLILLRHAKSDWPEGPDFDRPLAKRGRRDAPRMGRWLREHGFVPDVVICSAARRTQETWALLAPELPAPEPDVRPEPRAYAASALTLRYLIQELPGRYRTALLIAHNPGLAELTASLAGPALSAVDPALRPAADSGPPHPGPADSVPVSMAFPTAAAAVFELTGDWTDLWPGTVRLLAFVAPADLR